MTMADRIVILNDGRVEQVGTPVELYERPNNKFVAGFIGSPQMNFLALTVEARRENGLACVVEGLGKLVLPIQTEGAIEGKKVTLGIRPEHVQLAATESSIRLPALVNIVENLGSENLLHAEIAENQLLVAKIAAGVAPERNHRLALFLPAEHLYLFDEQEKVIPVSPLGAPGIPRPREKAETP
jgi:multiple sugar transport system ATP-binding protein